MQPVQAAKAAEADKLYKKATKAWQPSLLDFRLKPDWEVAAPLFERAAVCYKQAGILAQARDSYEKASQAQEKIGSAWHAAKHLETCGDISKSLNELPEVAQFYKRAALLYVEAGRGPTGGDCLARGAKVLEDSDPAVASSLYDEALDLYETEGKEGQAADVFRQAVALLIKNAKWEEAVSMLLRFGEGCDKSNARSSQCKAYLGAVVVWLYAQDAKQAWQVFQDVMEVGNFSGSEEAFAADALFMAYKSGSISAVKKVLSDKSCFKYLDNQLARLGQKLPQGDLAEQAKVMAAVMGGEASFSSNADGEEDEEEDIT